MAVRADGAQRLQSLAHDLSGTTNDQTYRFSYNPVGQSVERVSTNSAYAWPAPSNGTTAYTRNGLDQYTAVAGASYSYDARGNLSSNGTQSYGYDAANRLTTAPGSTALAYDPMDRLFELSVSGTGTRFLYDGVQAIGEYNASGTLLRRYVPGPALDEPITWYEGSGTSDRRWLVADQLGTIVAVTDGSGAATNINTFDEYGQPGASNAGRFQYTGQAWLAEAGLQYSRARAYAPTIGRFLQTDPILQAGGMNLYAYVGNDPVNAVDPSGLAQCGTITIDDIYPVKFCIGGGEHNPGGLTQSINNLTMPGGDTSGETGKDDGPTSGGDEGIVVTAPRPGPAVGFIPIQAGVPSNDNQCRWEIVWPSGPDSWNFVASNPIRLRAVGVGNAFNYSVRAGGISLSGNVMTNACSSNGCPAGSFSGLIGAFPRSINQYFASPVPSPSGLYQWQINQAGVGDAGGVRGSAVAARRGRGAVSVFVHRRVCGGS